MGKKRNDSMAGQIRKLSEGQILRFDIKRYSSVSTTVNIIKLQTNNNYKVRREAPHVIVERLKEEATAWNQ